MKPVYVIGSGPAGLSAALAAAECGCDPVILERMSSPSAKLLISGGGRCNFSNVLAPDEFMAKFGREGAFMRNALRTASREWLLDFLQNNGVKTELTDSFYWFPASGRASDIQQAFLRCSRAEVRLQAEVVKLCIRAGRLTGLNLKDGTQLPADKVILAAGGCAWAGLGTDAGLRLAEEAGHTIRKPLPAVAPLIVREEWAGSLAGVTLENAQLTLHSGRQKLQTAGSVLFTHSGLSGFPALDLAGEAAALCDRSGTVMLSLNFRADMSVQDWQSLLQRVRRDAGQKSVKTFLAEYLPRSVAEIIVQLARCPETRICQLNAAVERLLPGLLTECPLTLTGAGPMDRAMAMRGGISLKEVDPATMESRKISGLFFAGEILDLTGPCGGYNIQWAISSGRLAGLSAARLSGD